MKFLFIFIFILVTFQDDFSRWMELDFEKIKNLKITDLTLPGTHESGAYEFSDIVSPDAPDFVYRLSREYNISTSLFFKEWSRNQLKNITQQLNDGIRYFDIRICESPLGEFLMCHGLFGVKIIDILEQFQKFLKESKKEVIVISFVVRHHVIHVKETDILIQRYLNQWILDKKFEFKINLDEMVQMNKRLICLYDTHDRYTSNVLWNSKDYLDSYWANTNDVNVLMMKEIKYIQERRDTPNKIFIPQWVTTPNSENIIATVLLKLNIPGQSTMIDSIEKLLFFTNQRLNEFIEKTLKYRFNVIFLDMYHGINIIELSRLLNDACNDSDRLNCYQYRNQCDSNPRIRELCKRSCGLCPIPKGYTGYKCNQDNECQSNICRYNTCLQKNPLSFNEKCNSNYQCSTNLCNSIHLRCQKRLIHDSCYSNQDCQSNSCIQQKCTGNEQYFWIGKAPLCNSFYDLCLFNNLTFKITSYSKSLCGDSDQCFIQSKTLCSNFIQKDYKIIFWLPHCNHTREDCLNSNFILETKCGNDNRNCEKGSRILCGKP